MVKQGYLRSKNISSKAYKAYQEKSLILATQALTETKDLVESYNAVTITILHSKNHLAHFFTVKINYVVLMKHLYPILQCKDLERR